MYKAEDELSVDLADHGLTTFQGVHQWAHTTDNSVVITELVTTVVSGTVVTLTFPAGTDNDKRVVVIGGGENARSYVNIARRLGADEASCDQIGIEVIGSYSPYVDAEIIILLDDLLKTMSVEDYNFEINSSIPL